MIHMEAHSKLIKHFEKHEQWELVKKTCKTLQSQGHVAYIAGGAVRDALMGKTPKDFDIATSALPFQIFDLFPRALKIGVEFGVVILPTRKGPLEVATFRSDRDYKDGRRPHSIIFSNAREDALRRDFTINAMFFDIITGEVIDYCNGEEDIKHKTIRTVGDPHQRFEEDKLRVIRAIRFLGQLDFTFDVKLEREILKYKGKLHQISKERIFQEIIKIASSPFPLRSLKYIRHAGLEDDIFQMHFNEDHWKKIKRSFQKWAHLLSYDLIWFLLYIDGEEFYQKALRDLRPPKYLLEQGLRIQKVKSSLKQNDYLTAAKLLEKCNSSSQVFLYEELAGESSFNNLLCFMDEKNDETGLLPEPLVNGKDLMSMGQKPGPELGEKLKRGFELQISKPLLDKTQLLNLLKEIL